MADFSERTLRVDDIDLFARDYAATGGTPEAKLPVICIHGLSRNSRDFEELAPRIAALGRRVVALDVRGRGRSGYDPVPERYLPRTYVGDTIKWLDALNIPRAVFIGTSMGGILSMILAKMVPDRVGAIVINDIGPHWQQEALDRIMANVINRPPPAADWSEAARRARLLNEHAYPNANERFWLEFAHRTYAQQGGKIALDYDPAIAAPTEALWLDTPEKPPAPDLTPIFDATARKPLLVVRGQLSDILSKDDLAYMTDRAPLMKNVTVPGVGHTPYLTEPVAWEAVSTFLRDVP